MNSIGVSRLPAEHDAKDTTANELTIGARNHRSTVRVQHE